MKTSGIHLETLELQTSLCRIGLLLIAMLLSACAHMEGGEDSSPLNFAFETIPADEALQIADITLKTAELQRKRAKVFKEVQIGQILRGVHPKTHGCVVADFTVNPNIAADYQVGLFATPGKKYKALIRYSNASVRLASDLENGNGSRGMAVKVLNVSENVLVKDVDQSNQDFLMINTRAFAFPNVRSYQRLTNALLSSPSGADPSAAFAPADDWTREDGVNLEKTRQVIAQIKKKTVRVPTDVQYFAAAPSLFGIDRVMKFSAEPCGGEKIQTPFEDEPGENYLRQALLARMAPDQEPVCLDFKIQALTINQVRKDRDGSKGENASDLIEDATRVWNENEFPFINVAQIIIPTAPLDKNSILQDCETRAFNPWHSLTAHQPLGGINRLRKPVYVISAVTRGSDAPENAKNNLEAN